MTAKSSAHPQRLLAGIILFTGVGLYGYVTLAVQPLLRALNDLSGRVRAASVQLQQVQQLVAQEGTVRQEYARLTSNVTKLRTGLPNDTEMPSVIQLLSDLADQSGVKIVSIFPQRTLDRPELSPKPVKDAKSGKSAPAPPVQPPLYKEIPIEIEAVTGFHQLGMFLSRVESASQPMRLKKLHIDADQKEIKRQSVNAVLIAYFALTSKTASTTGPGLPLVPNAGAGKVGGS